MKELHWPLTKIAGRDNLCEAAMKKRNYLAHKQISQKPSLKLPTAILSRTLSNYIGIIFVLFDFVRNPIICNAKQIKEKS